MKYILFTVIAFFTIAIVEAKEPPTIESQYITAINSPLAETYNPFSCISYAKWRVGVSQSEHWGDARKIVPNAQNATVGDFVLTTEGNGHIAYIEALEGNSMLISEANYIAGEVSTRSLSLDDPRIRGYLVLQ